MTVFAIADLHLSDGDKPMDVFGAQWERHFERICKDWRARVTDADVVLLPGDFSWAMLLEDARRHLALLDGLPGGKILIKGNHDYWWSSISRVRDALPARCYALQNDAMALDGVLFCGTRGWLLPGEAADKDDEKIYRREVMRLEMSLRAARAISCDMPLCVMMHFPPCTEQNRDTEFTRLLAAYGADTLVYGHLHGAALRQAFRGEMDGVKYVNASCDGLGFRLAALDIASRRDQ